MNFIRKIIIFVLVVASALFAFSMTAFAAEIDDNMSVASDASVSISPDFDINNVEYTHYIHSGSVDSRSLNFVSYLREKYVADGYGSYFKVPAALSNGYYGDTYVFIGENSITFGINFTGVSVDTVVRVRYDRGTVEIRNQDGTFEAVESVGICFYTDDTFSEVGMPSYVSDDNDWSWGGLFSGFPTPPPKALNSVTNWFSCIGDGLSSFTASVVGSFTGGIDSLVYDELGNYTVAFGFIVLALITGVGFAIFKIVRRKKV